MIDKLEMFVALAREGHFGRAATAHGVTQPTLSSAIRALEDQLGVQLVIRGARYQGLTPEGLRTLDWARRITRDARHLRDEMRSARRGVAGHIRLGVIPTALARVAQITAPFMAAHPQVRLTIRSASSAEIVEGLETFELDAGVSYIDGLPARISHVPFFEEHYRLVERSNETGPLPWVEAASRPLCLLTPEMQNRRIIDRHLGEAGVETGVEAQARLSSNSTITLLAHVAQGGWSAILPQALAEGVMLPAGCTARALTPEFTHPIGMILPSRDLIGPALQALLGQIEAKE
ncbi:LysR family transcriptional regulator [Albirhodobacter sp. R86504]|uniref:LysR family transcriptional regulator n=1 Tax=Albirhodobacter sp. R86504 TaxID=3093848 RepID=UPI0036736159